MEVFSEATTVSRNKKKMFHPSSFPSPRHAIINLVPEAYYTRSSDGAAVFHLTAFLMYNNVRIIK